MKKRITALALACVMVLGTAALAAGTEKTISVTPMDMTINGQSVTPTKSNGDHAEVFAYDDTTYVPLRYLSELLNIEVVWDKDHPNTAALVNVPGFTAPAGGTFTGTGAGFGGEVKAVITVADGKITACTLTGEGETPAIGGAALPKLQEQVLAAGSDKIDGVSGATMTSNGVKAALAAALSQAAGAGETEQTVKDGVYTATAPGFSWTGMITCDVTFQDDKLTAVDVKEEHETETGELFGMVKSTYIPRMIQHQSLSVDAVAGATVSSAAIRTIVTDAVEQAGGKAADWYRPVSKSTEVKKLEGYDVIVVGMGGSGMLSFCAAADQGAKVIGLEKGGKLGGNSTTTTGPMALNSKYLNDGEPYINEDDVFNTWMEYVEGKKEAVVRRAVYESTAALEYYIENFDFEFDGLIMSFAKPEWNKLWTRYVNDPATEGPNKLGPNKTYMYQRAVDKAIAESAGSEYKLETTVTEMLTDDKGNVVGVKAVNVDGTTYEVYGKSVILATGGYIANTEMMMEQFGATTQTLGCTLCTGDGIKLGQSVGGATYALDVLPMIHIEQVPNLIKNDDLTGEEKAILSALALVRGQRGVNIKGEAFDRGKDAAAECYVPGFRYYAVYTQEEIDGFRTKGLPENFASATSHFMAQGTFTTGTPGASMDKILSVGEKYGNVISGSVSDLAKGIGCDEATLSKTLGGKDGKYYAVCCAGYAYATVGGLDINENMNVLKTDGSAIKNLFAVGQDSEGVCNISGKAYSPWGGQAQSWTFVSGRIAGQQAAKVAGK